MIPPTSATASTPSVVVASPAITRPPQDPAVVTVEVNTTGFDEVPWMSIAAPF